MNRNARNRALKEYDLDECIKKFKKEIMRVTKK